jgi:hypothetical protein
LSAIQASVLRIVDGAGATIAGGPVSSAEWFAALKFLAAVIRFSGVTVGTEHTDRAEKAFLCALPDEYGLRRAGTNGNAGGLRAMPSTARIAAGLLLAAHTVLGAANPAQCAQAIRPLAAAATAMHRGRRHNPLRTMPIPAGLSRVFDTVVAPGSRVAGRVPSVEAATARIEFRNLPQLVDLGDYRALIARHLPGTAEPTGRRLAALAVARSLGARSWREAAVVLDMEQQKAARVTNVVVQRITDPDGFWAAIVAARTRLCGRGLIDYAARRRQLAALQRIPPAVMHAACREQSHVVSTARRTHAAAWTWQQLTGGDIREAPAYQHVSGATLQSVREGARRFAVWIPEHVSAHLVLSASGVFLEQGSGR